MRFLLCVLFAATVACAAVIPVSTVFAQQTREYTTTQGGTFRVYDAKLRRCYDGDTCYFDVYLGFGHVMMDQVVRLCDIDTPEIRPLVTRDVAEEAKQVLQGWIFAGTEIELHVLQKNDCRITDNKMCDDGGKFGRYLVYIYVDGRNLNAAMVEDGHARILTDKAGKAILCKGK